MATGEGAEDLDVCPECLGPFTDPKFLPCHHTVCAPCIQKIAKRYSKRTFPCPACQKPTSLPRKGVRALQSNVYARSTKETTTKTSTPSTPVSSEAVYQKPKQPSRKKKDADPQPETIQEEAPPWKSLYFIPIEFVHATEESTQNSEKMTVHLTTLKTFLCSDEPNLKVFSLYHTKFYLPRDSLFVYVCFEPTGPSNKVLVRQFFDDGRFVGEWESDKGLVTMKYFCHDIIHHRMELEYNKGTFAKSKPIGLEQESSTKARVVKYWLSAGELDVIRATHFNINVRRHRAVDVDDAANVVVVVEEPRTPGGRRNVLMYRRPGANAVCVYTPPNARNFQPADVCFFRFNGEEVLLVADEASAAIHVAKIGRTTLTFDRFLNTDCPELRYPTSLAVDAQGRLWVACKGGLIVALYTVVKIIVKASAKPPKVQSPKPKVQSPKSLKSSKSSSFNEALCAIGFLLIAVFIGLVFYLSTPMK